MNTSGSSTPVPVTCPSGNYKRQYFAPKGAIGIPVNRPRRLGSPAGVRRCCHAPKCGCCDVFQSLARRMDFRQVKGRSGHRGHRWCQIRDHHPISENCGRITGHPMEAASRMKALGEKERSISCSHVALISLERSASISFFNSL